MVRYLGFLRLDVPRPVRPGGYRGMDFEVEVRTEGSGAPDCVWAHSGELLSSGFRDVRGRPRDYRSRRLYMWLLDRALTFRIENGTARDLRALPVDPDRADHLPYVPVPMLDAGRLGVTVEELLSGQVPLPDTLAGFTGGPLQVVLANGRFWGPFVPATPMRVGVHLEPGTDGLSWMPAVADGTEVLLDGETCFVRQDRYTQMVRQLATLARADGLARVRVVGTARTRAGRPEFRSISELYEGWCLVQLVMLLEKLGCKLQAGSHTAVLQQAVHRRTVPQVPAGGEFLHVSRQGFQVRLVYDAELPHTRLTARAHRQEFFAATPHNRPDFRLDLIVGDTCVRSLVLDAKRRRLKHLWDESGYTPAMGQLHSYAFGLRHRDRPLESVVRAVIALYSGHGADPSWLELEGGSVILARLAPGRANTSLQVRLRRFLEEG